MTLEAIREKYEQPDEINWDAVSDDDLYSFLDSQRETFELLAEEKVLSNHYIYPVIRRRAVTSLYFLSRFTWDSNPYGGPSEDISLNLMTRENHDLLIGMFIEKDPDKDFKELSEFKTAIILYPRGSMKSSWGIQDAIQWTLYDFKIRILVLTAADDLASAIVDEIRGYFSIKERIPSFMNLFFPEHCAMEKDLKGEGEFTSPAWAAKQIKRREPTIMAKSITSTISGFHFDVLHADDSVSDRNSNNEDACATVKKRYGLTRKTLMSYGYTTLIGTRYFESDIYGIAISQNDLGECETQTFGITAKKLINRKNKTKILIGQAMTIKPDVEKRLADQNVPREQWFRQAGKDGVELVIPNVYDYDVLLSEYEKDPAAFETQMRQNVNPPTQQSFTRELLLSSFISFAEVPVFGRRTVTFDIAGSKGKPGNDDSVGTCVIWDNKGVGILIDTVAQAYPHPLSAAQGIVGFCKKHHPDMLSIEDSAGVRNLEPTLWAEADKSNDEFVKHTVRHIHWRPVDTSKDAKRNRIMNMYPLFVYKRFKIVDHIPYREKMIQQFIKPITLGSKNDIPDCISFQTIFQPAMQESDEIRHQREAEQKQFIQEERRKSQWYMLYEENNNPAYEYEKQEEEPQFFTPPPSDNDSVLGGFY